MFNRRSLLSKLFGVSILGSVNVAEPASFARASLTPSGPLRMVTATLDTSAIAKAVNDAMRTLRFSLPDGSFIVVPPLTVDAEYDTIVCGPSTG